MSKIAVITATRAEYGLLAPVIRELRRAENAGRVIELIVTGTHLSEEYGMTVKEIRDRKMRIDHEIRIPVRSDSALDISGNQAAALVRFTELFAAQRYRAILILGDRYEMLAVAMAAVNTGTPIFHISGGDVTEGAVDDCIRHAITKMSYLHFTTNEDSRRRVIQLGEAPDRVFNFGSVSIDNVLHMAVMSREEAMDSIGISNPRYAVCTWHPVTLEEDMTAEYTEAFLSAVRHFPDIDFVVTKANADQGGAQINRMLDAAEGTVPNLHVYDSLGVKRYLSLMKHALFVMGNSSSGIVETPAFHIPTVNIGNRQRGRLQTESVINCAPDAGSIIRAAEQALDPVFRQACKAVVSPYGDGHAAEKIAKKVLEQSEKPIDLEKSFYEIEVTG